MDRRAETNPTRPSHGDAQTGLPSRGFLNVVECGAVGDGSQNSTAALQRALDRCAESGGGTVLIPPGIYRTGTLWMRSHVTLHLEPGATLAGESNVALYPLWASRWEGCAATAHAPLIGGEDLQNVSIVGRGSIDGRGQMWWDLFNQQKLSHTRPNLIRLVNCRDVLIDGLTLLHSPRWALNPTACDNVTITSLTVRSPHDSPNTDGINPDSCSNVHISNCHIDVGDDCITIKSGSEEDGRRMFIPCRNITITNCTMLHGHGGVVIGSEMSGGVRNVAISNCVFSGTDRGIRLKSRRGRGGIVEDICASNIVMDNVLCPIALNLFYGCGAETQGELFNPALRAVDHTTPRVRRLRFSHIIARQVKYAAAFVLGLPEMCIEDVTLDDVSLYLDPANTQAGAPAMAPGIPDMCRAGVVLRNTRNFKLRRVDIHDQLGPAISINESHDVLVGDLHAASRGDAPLITVDGADATDDGHIVQSHARTWRLGRPRAVVTVEPGLSKRLSRPGVSEPG